MPGAVDRVLYSYALTLRFAIMKIFCFAFLFLFLSLTQAEAGERKTGLLQSEALSEFAGASKNLTGTMICLKGRVYPNDVEKCGVSSFGNAALFEEVESCLALKTAKRAFPIGRKLGDKETHRIALTIECNERQILIMFKKRRGEFFVDDIGFLLD